MKEIYLDNAASTQIDLRVLNTYIDASMRLYGNPSNTKHKLGRDASRALEAARTKIGQCLELNPRGIIFTSGATEANNLALRGIACLQKSKCTVLISSIEHACVDESAMTLFERGNRVSTAPAMSNGQTNLRAMDKLIKSDNRLKLVSNLLVNNETGVIQPLHEIIKLAKSAPGNILVHTDAVQAIGKIPVGVLKQADMVSISGHKINGPKGIGLLWVKPGLGLNPLLVGGGQENGKRSGTSPVPSIIAFAKAIEIATRDTEWLYMVNKEMRALEQRLIRALPGKIKINGIGAPRVANISNMSFSLKGTLIDHLQGVAASAGAACSCPKPQPSKVLLAMGLPADLAKNCLRLSAGRKTTAGEIRLAGDRIIAAAKKLV